MGKLGSWLYRVPALAVAVVVCAGLAGCGGSGPDVASRADTEAGQAAAIVTPTKKCPGRAGNCKWISDKDGVAADDEALAPTQGWCLPPNAIGLGAPCGTRTAQMRRGQCRSMR